MHVWPLYGLMTAVVVGYSMAKRRVTGDDPPIAACWLAALFLASNFSHWVVPDPYNQFFPFCDCMVGVILVVFWWRRMKLWMLGIILLLGVDMVLHVANLRFGLRGAVYDLALNGAYVLQLACVTVPGLLSALSNHRASNQIRREALI